MAQKEWSSRLLRRVSDALARASAPIDLVAAPRVHLAIFVEPFLGLIFDGQKTIESRFGVQRCAPHGRVAEGDILLLKRAGGPVVGVCRVSKTWSFDLPSTSLETIRRRFARQLCAEDPEFWSTRAHVKLATLMEINDVVSIPPIQIEKRDRRGWVIVRERSLQLECAG